MTIKILWILFFAMTGIQLIYLLFIYGRLGLFFRPAAAKATSPLLDDEGVSIIIAARNEKKNLEKLIPLLFEQDYPKFEILIVNDRSTDGTKFFLDNLMKTYPKLRSVTIQYLPRHVTAKKYALTLGIKVAKYDVILLTDADCIPVSQQWIQMITDPVRKGGKTFSIGFGGYEKSKGMLNKIIQFDTLFTALQYISFGLWGFPYMGVGRNLSYRKSFFMEEKAFKNLWHIEGGDDDLFINRHANKNNTAVVIHPESITLSKPMQSFKAHRKQKLRHFSVGKFYRYADKLKIGLYAFSQLIFWFSALLLLISQRSWEPIALILGIIGIRTLIQEWVFRGAQRRLEGETHVIGVMFFEFMYLFYFWIIGTQSYLSKKVRWK
ncbi:glycosyltransferase [Pararhodonellum marinum]|uniref:glycosyltransferase n=1 Tax=Pararhodonellum marinum TaxID=2755358 RepID=UPI00188E493C|nr:glycosyltransferase [Pararhodonellum marinum]